MNFEPDEEQIVLRDLVRRFLADREDAATIGQGPMARVDWRALGGLGLFCFLLPERGGGMDGRPQDAAIVSEELGRALAITPLAEGILGAADLVARYGDQAQIDRWVAPALAGNMMLALAEGAVRADGDRLSGHCGFVRWAADAGALVVPVSAAVHIVPADAPGVTIAPVRLADGCVAGQVTFEDVMTERFPVAPAAIATTLACVQLGYVGEMVGAMALLYEQTIDYVRQRQQFGVPIGSFQVVQHKLARMFVALEQSQSLLLKAGIADREEVGFERRVLAAKAYIADAAQRLGEEAVQLHGGMGVTDELTIGRGLRRILLLARLFGGAGEARSRLAA